MALVRAIRIENWKSVRELDLELGRFNVLIGANGSGKSNVLEAIAYGSAMARGKLDNEYLVPRGIRTTEPRWLRAMFPDAGGDDITVSFRSEGQEQARSFSTEYFPREQALLGKLDAAVQRLLQIQQVLNKEARDALARIIAITSALPPDFLVYSPESSALRVFQAEPQILPLGVRGEGLFAHLKELAARAPALFAEIVEHLAVFDWFEALEIPSDLAAGERSLRIRDRYLAPDALFDQRSANEGFLFTLFYLTLMISDTTPSFFAMDNVDASLNPRLVRRLVGTLVELAGKHDKQVIATTHSPAVLDALDLGDDEQRLMVVERRKSGDTRARRVQAPRPVGDEAPLPLSEAFVRGFLGGLPKGF